MKFWMSHGRSEKDKIKKRTEYAKQGYTRTVISDPDNRLMAVDRQRLLSNQRF